MINILILVGIVAVIAADQLSPRVQAYMNRAPHSVLKLAARRLDEDIRRDYLDEWRADCDYRWLAERGTRAVPFTYLMGAIIDAISVLLHAREIDDCVGGAGRARSPRIRFHDVRLLAFLGGAIIGGCSALIAYTVVDGWTSSPGVSQGAAWALGGICCVGFWANRRCLKGAFCGIVSLALTWLVIISFV